ncbi:MAG: hypothetical protein S4CHLAM6_14460 [Chlamydiae bacterium]|nr:hypothetical protein [Chlamydiota bacterium]
MPAVLGTLNNLSNFTGLGYLGSSVKSVGSKEYKQAGTQFAEGTLRLGLTAAVSALSVGIVLGDGKLSLSSNVFPATTCVAYTDTGGSAYTYKHDCGVVNLANLFFYNVNGKGRDFPDKQHGAKSLEKLFSKDFPVEAFEYITKSPTRAAMLVKDYCGTTTDVTHCGKIKLSVEDVMADVNRRVDCEKSIREKCLSKILGDSSLMSRLFSITIKEKV